MSTAINETNRRRNKQLQHNEAHHIVPASVHKEIRDLTDQLSAAAKDKAMALAEGRAEYRAAHDKTSRAELERMASEVEARMREAAKVMEFEKAAALRDELYELRAILADDEGLKPWERIKLLKGEGRPDAGWDR